MSVNFKAAFIVAQAGLLIASSFLPLTALPAQAAATVTANSAISGRLDKIEEVIYGAPKKGQTLDARLKALEVKLFGVPRKGTLDVRLANINKVLSYGNGRATGDLLPPLAPTLDNGSPAAAPAGNNSGSGSGSGASSYGGDNSAYDSSGSAYDSSSSSSSGSGSGPDNSSALADAMQLYQAGKIAQAEAAFKKVIASDPNNGDAYYNLGVIAEGKGDLSGALADYRSALNINPQDNELQNTVAAVQSKVDAQRAQADSAAQAKRDADSKAQLKTSVAQAANDYKQGRYDDAINKLSNISAQVPNDADVQYALAQAYRGKGDLSNARSHMLRATSLNPSNSGYAAGLTAIDQAIAAKTKFNDSYASANQPASSATQSDGQITPFANSQASGLSGIASRTSSSVNNRLKRAVSYGVAGAIGGALTGALFRPTYGGSRMSGAKAGALRGAILGTVFGLATGH